MWLIWSESYEEALKLLNDTNLSVDSDVSLIVSEYSIYDLYKIHYNMGIISHRISEWSSEHGYTRKSLKPLRNNLHGFVMNISAVVSF